MSKKKSPDDLKVFHLTRKDLINLIGIEKLRVELAMILSRGNVKSASKILGISERNCFRKVNQYDLDMEEYRNAT